MRNLARFALGVALVVAPARLAVSASAPKPAGSADRCPVCGMFVAKYPDFEAQMALKNGRVLHFDGVKDLAKRWLGLGGAGAPLRVQDVQAVWVQDYYSLRWIDGQRGFYVAGSDVYGPMGKELIPFASEADARGFLKDHRGTAVLRFQDLTAEIMKQFE